MNSLNRENVLDHFDTRTYLWNFYIEAVLGTNFIGIPNHRFLTLTDFGIENLAENNTFIFKSVIMQLDAHLVNRIE